MPKFVLKDMEGLYIEEMNAAINLLKVNKFIILEITLYKCSSIGGNFLDADPDPESALVKNGSGS